MRRIRTAFLLLTVGTTVQAQTFTMGMRRGAILSRSDSDFLQGQKAIRPSDGLLPSDRSSEPSRVDPSLSTSGAGNATLVLTLAAVAVAGTGAGAWTLRRRALR